MMVAVVAVLCGLGGWGNSSGPQHKGCMCEVINLGDLLRFFFFPYSLSAHTQLLAGEHSVFQPTACCTGRRGRCRGLCERADVVSPFAHIPKCCELVSKEPSP